MPFELPKLNYAYTDLEPHIDARTMEIHHQKHHQAYITNLNTALELHPELGDIQLEDLITSLDTLPSDIRTAVRNNGGGHYNHSLFWEMLSPNSTTIPDTITQHISATFGSLELFKTEFKKSALARFGSGWTWLIKSRSELKIVSMPNQDNPLMEDSSLKLLLGLDVWEHAYYLAYQNRKADYIDAFWKVVNWQRLDDKLA